MKVYISADIEGVTGVSHWDETMPGKEVYTEYKEQMTEEVVAACEGALSAGAKEILVKDAHGTGRNIIAARLPMKAKLIRGWSQHPFSMLQELNQSVKAVIMIGYHSRAGSNKNPLAHTLSYSTISSLKINGWYASEFLVNTFTAATVKVPVVFVSGDEGLCQEIASFNDKINTVAVKRGVGLSTISIHPKLALEKIKEGTENAFKGDYSSLCAK
ncbi:M55 family metallopeptidase, partial [Candidatus Riflebacteria bacterium]